MFVIGDSQTTWFDVDDTLIMWNFPKDGVEQVIKLDPWNDGKFVELVVNTAMVDQLKAHAVRGHPVIVWSAGGWKWAKTVVEALGIQKYVTLVVEKPTWAYDDKRAEDFMPKTQWVGPKEWLK